MADQLYLSLWYPNFRLEALPAALEKVMEQFIAVGGSGRVSAATVYPISWNETPAWQRVYRNETDDEEASPRAVLAAAMENAHDDYAWEFEMIWELWIPEPGQAGLDTTRGSCRHILSSPAPPPGSGTHSSHSNSNSQA